MSANRASLRRRFIALCRAHNLSDADRHAIVGSITGGRTESVADPRGGKKVATDREIVEAIEWVVGRYGDAGPSPAAPLPSPHGGRAGDGGRADWIKLPDCPIRRGLATAATIRKIFAIARDKLGSNWLGRLEGLALGDYPRNPVALFHRRRAGLVAGGIGERLAELPELEAAKIIQLLRRKGL